MGCQEVSLHQCEYHEHIHSSQPWTSLLRIPTCRSLRQLSSIPYHCSAGCVLYATIGQHQALCGPNQVTHKVHCCSAGYALYAVRSQHQVLCGLNLATHRVHCCSAGYVLCATIGQHQALCDPNQVAHKVHCFSVVLCDLPRVQYGPRQDGQSSDSKDSLALTNWVYQHKKG